MFDTGPDPDLDPAFQFDPTRLFDTGSDPEPFLFQGGSVTKTVLLYILTLFSLSVGRFQLVLLCSLE